ncbi:hypothetical protein [Candidatus Poriferisodalis sp.]|uniref:hypothetical protein n=1 Tax=Candidatus Poriferisodalis sp. TaxID=3101277 RepID=UPI003B029701
MSRSEVEEIAAEAVAEAVEQQLGQEGLEQLIEESVTELRSEIDDLSPGADEQTMAEAVEQRVLNAVQQSLQQQLPTTEELAWLTHRVIFDSIPPRSDAAAYTKYIVDDAIKRYDDSGREAAIRHYSNPDSVDGQWYVFMVDENAEVIAHPEALRIGHDLNGAIGTDINGYVFGHEVLSATEDGKWVPYFYVNPEGGTLSDDGVFELKNAWVVRHDGILFASGWYVDSEELLPGLIDESVDHYLEGGLEAILSFYTDPQGLSAGLIPTVQYYNSTDVLGVSFSGFIADPDGKLLVHFYPELVGTDIVDLLGPAVRDATDQRRWITAEDNPDSAEGPSSMRVYVRNVDGTLIGAGWYGD